MVSYFRALIGLVGLGCSTLLTLGLISDTAANRAKPALVPVGHLSIDRDATVPPASDEFEDEDETVATAEADVAADPYANDYVVPVPAAREPSGKTGAASAARSARNTTASPEKGTRSRTIKRVCRVTAYCDRGITASGVSSGVGQCAAPADIPFGSKIYIPKLNRTFVVTDRTHKRFRKSTVDLFMPGKTQCLEFGRNYLEVVITLPEQPWKRPKGR